MASESLAPSAAHTRRRSRLLRDLARYYRLHLIIGLPVTWFIVFKYLPMYGAQIAFRDFAAAKSIWGSSWVGDEFNYEGFLIDSSHVYYDHIPEVWVPRMALGVEDAKTVSEIRSVVNDFVYESAAKFVTGRLDINDDNDWNNFLAELDKIGLPQYLEIMNAAYEAYK